jgi:DNA mismatch endonuclease Vsr
MPDIFDKEKRSQIMSKVKNKDTKPEIIVRKLLYSIGYRYRVNYSKLPCKPDIIFVRKKKVIFVNGCLWHGHDCKRGKLPDTNVEKWATKITVNIERDKRNYSALAQIGWSYLVIWQCEIKKGSMDMLEGKIREFLKENNNGNEALKINYES